jgi:hypothetical protein
MPAVLCVHLKRFAWIGDARLHPALFMRHSPALLCLTARAEQNRVKLATHVEFPSILRLNQRCVRAVMILLCAVAAYTQNSAADV